MFPPYIELVNSISKHDQNPYKNRPWLAENGLAAPAGGTSKGLKGIVAGGLTGCIEVMITYPTEFVKTHLQLDEKGDKKQYTGIVDCVKKTVNKHGFFGLYRGLSVLLYCAIPKNGVRFGSFEFYKERMVLPSGNLSLGGRFLCGLGAGVTEAIVIVTPMETIKVKFIHDRRLPQPKFRGFIHGISVIVREAGIGGIYKGLTATILKQGSNQAIRFFVIESCKDAYRGGDPKKNVPKIIVGIFGAVAGGISVLSNAPLDVIKTRMQGLDAHAYKNTWDCVVKTYTNEGIKAFYKGTVPRLCRVCIDVAITFAVYDSFMDLFNKVWK